MLELLFANISTLDLSVVAIVLTLTVLWRRGLPDVHVDVHRNSRMFTIIQNKWQTRLTGSTRIFKPSWFITIETKYFKKKLDKTGIEFWNVDGKLKPLGAFSDPKCKRDPLTGISGFSQYHKPEHVEIFMESANEQIDFEDFIVGANGQSLDDFIETSMRDIGIPEDPRVDYESEYKVFMDSYKSCCDAMSRRRMMSANARAQAVLPLPIKKYTVHFHIPFMVRWQFNRMMTNFTRVNLKEKDKDELLQKLYWDYEERRLAC